MKTKQKKLFWMSLKSYIHIQGIFINLYNFYFLTTLIKNLKIIKISKL